MLQDILLLTQRLVWTAWMRVSTNPLARKLTIFPAMTSRGCVHLDSLCLQQCDRDSPLHAELLVWSAEVMECPR